MKGTRSTRSIRWRAGGLAALVIGAMGAGCGVPSPAEDTAQTEERVVRPGPIMAMPPLTVGCLPQVPNCTAPMLLLAGQPFRLLGTLLFDADGPGRGTLASQVARALTDHPELAKQLGFTGDYSSLQLTRPAALYWAARLLRLEGFNTVRYAIAPETVLGFNGDTTAISNYVKGPLTQSITALEDAGMYVVIDFHGEQPTTPKPCKVPSDCGSNDQCVNLHCVHATVVDAHNPVFYHTYALDKLWGAIGARFHGDPYVAAWELYNEIGGNCGVDATHTAVFPEGGPYQGKPVDSLTGIRAFYTAWAQAIRATEGSSPKPIILSDCHAGWPGTNDSANVGCSTLGVDSLNRSCLDATEATWGVANASEHLAPGLPGQGWPGTMSSTLSGLGPVIFNRHAASSSDINYTPQVNAFLYTSGMLYDEQTFGQAMIAGELEGPQGWYGANAGRQPPLRPQALQNLYGQQGSLAAVGGDPYWPSAMPFLMADIFSRDTYHRIDATHPPDQMATPKYQGVSYAYYHVSHFANQLAGGAGLSWTPLGGTSGGVATLSPAANGAIPGSGGALWWAPPWNTPPAQAVVTYAPQATSICSASTAGKTIVSAGAVSQTAFVQTLCGSGGQGTVITFPVHESGFDPGSTFDPSLIGGNHPNYCDHVGPDQFAVDVAPPAGDPHAPVYSIAPGTVVYAGPAISTKYGNVVMVQHGLGPSSSELYYSLYAHLDQIDTIRGLPVDSSTQIGTIGRTGLQSNAAAHLHFALRRASPTLPSLCTFVSVTSVPPGVLPYSLPTNDTCLGGGPQNAPIAQPVSLPWILQKVTRTNTNGPAVDCKPGDFDTRDPDNFNMPSVPGGMGMPLGIPCTSDDDCAEGNVCGCQGTAFAVCLPAGSDQSCAFPVLCTPCGTVPEGSCYNGNQCLQGCLTLNNCTTPQLCSGGDCQGAPNYATCVGIAEANDCIGAMQAWYGNGSPTATTDPHYQAVTTCLCGACGSTAGAPAVCSLAPNWSPCSSDSQCQSSWCGCNGGSQMVCLPNTNYPKTCTTLQPNGSACSTDSQCQSSWCACMGGYPGTSTCQPSGTPKLCGGADFTACATDNDCASHVCGCNGGSMLECLPNATQYTRTCATPCTPCGIVPLGGCESGSQCVTQNGQSCLVYNGCTVTHGCSGGTCPVNHDWNSCTGYTQTHDCTNQYLAWAGNGYPQSGTVLDQLLTCYCASCYASGAPSTCAGYGYPPTCNPTSITCASQGKNCGTITDGCGAPLYCGTCTSPQTCGGGGVPNQCGPSPSSCQNPCSSYGVAEGQCAAIGGNTWLCTNGCLNQTACTPTGSGPCANGQCGGASTFAQCQTLVFGGACQAQYQAWVAACQQGNCQGPQLTASQQCQCYYCWGYSDSPAACATMAHD